MPTFDVSQQSLHPSKGSVPPILGTSSKQVEAQAVSSVRTEEPQDATRSKIDPEAEAAWASVKHDPEVDGWIEPLNERYKFVRHGYETFKKLVEGCDKDPDDEAADQTDGGDREIGAKQERIVVDFPGLATCEGTRAGEKQYVERYPYCCICGTGVKQTLDEVMYHITVTHSEAAEWRRQNRKSRIVVIRAMLQRLAQAKPKSARIRNQRKVEGDPLLTD